LLYAFSDKELRKMWRSKVDQDLWHTLYVTAGELELFFGDDEDDIVGNDRQLTCFLRLLRMTQSRLAVVRFMPSLTADMTDALTLSLR